jgi:hypothetical protein
MKPFIRAVGAASWLAAVVITICIVWSFTSDQGPVSTSIAMLAISMSAIGLFMARSAWNELATMEFTFGLAIWIGGTVFLTGTEIAFWANAYETQYQAYQSQRAGQQRAEGLLDRDFKALTTGAAPESSAQITAMINAKRFDPAIERSDGCINFARISRKDSREACEEFFALQARLAAAEKREKMERDIASPGPVAVAIVAKNAFANAEVISRLLGGQVRTWADAVTLVGWLFLMLVRDMGLLVAFPPVRHEREQTPKAPDEAPRPKPVNEVSATGDTKVTPIREASKDKRTAATDFERPDLVRKTPVQTEDLPSRFSVRLAVDNDRKSRRKHRKQTRDEQTGGRVAEWIRECVSQEAGAATSVREVQQAYHQWCEMKGIDPASNKRLGAIMSATLQIRKLSPGRGPRNKLGKLWPIAVSLPEVERMVA